MRDDDNGDSFEGSFDVLRDSTWLCSADLPWDRDTVVQIQEVRKHKNLKLRDETKSVAGTLMFVGKRKHLLLNAGHRAVLKHLFGDAKGARGGWIALFVDPEVEAFGKIVSAVRIRAKRVAPPGKQTTPAPAPTQSAAADSSFAQPADGDGPPPGFESGAEAQS